VLLEVVMSFGVARRLELASGLAAAEEKTVLSGSPLFEPPLSLFARPAKLDNVAHP
jgi:hypothetical protein